MRFQNKNYLLQKRKLVTESFRIKAFLFSHRGKDFYAFRYESDSLNQFGFFNEKGESMKKALLSAPLEYTRISSKFSNRRLHPITRKYRPHHGLDYAAPTGTDVVELCRVAVLSSQTKRNNNQTHRL